MRVLLDTNVLSRSVQRGHPQQRTASTAVKQLMRQSNQVYTVPQVLFEFWVACTRPKAANGLGLEIQNVRRRIDRLNKVFTCLHDPDTLVDVWLDYVTRYRVSGKNAHDARLVAAMDMHGITHLLTFNTPDFGRYPGIVLLSPSDVAWP